MRYAARHYFGRTDSAFEPFRSCRHFVRSDRKLGKTVASAVAGRRRSSDTGIHTLHRYGRVRHDGSRAVGDITRDAAGDCLSGRCWQREENGRGNDKQ